MTVLPPSRSLSVPAEREKCPILCIHEATSVQVIDDWEQSWHGQGISLPAECLILAWEPAHRKDRRAPGFTQGFMGPILNLLTAWPCSHCIHGTADELGSLGTASLHQLCLQKAKFTPLLVLERDNTGSLHSLQREPHTGVDVPTNFPWSANNCTRFYSTPKRRGDEWTKRKYTKAQVSETGRNTIVSFQLLTARKSIAPWLEEEGNESPALLESGNTCVGICKRVSIKISTKIFYLVRK